MNDEIKEILDKMKNYSGECHSILAYSLCGYKKKIRNDFRMCMNDVDKLLDYITNLQQRSVGIGEYNTLVNKYNEIYKENERLKKTNVYCNRTDCVGRIKDSRKYDSVYQEKEDYKSRCEKVSEIIEKEKENMGYAKYDGCLLLIENIIKNRSDDNE